MEFSIVDLSNERGKFRVDEIYHVKINLLCLTTNPTNVKGTVNILSNTFGHLILVIMLLYIYFSEIIL